MKLFIRQNTETVEARNDKKIDEYKYIIVAKHLPNIKYNLEIIT